MHKFITIILSLAFLNNAYADNRTTLYDFRFWESPERTRIVFDVEKGIRYKVSSSQNKITLQIKNAKLLNRTYSKLFYQDKRIIKTNVRRDKDSFFIFFKTAKKYKVKTFKLKPNKKYPHHRVVIDLYDKEVKKIAKPTNKKIILIDAGHGGEDSGALGYKKSKEKNITLQISKKLAKRINQNKKFKAVLSRTGDYYISLSKRIKIAQKNNAALFISIHADAVRRFGAQGASVYTLSKRGESSSLAKQLEQSENTADKFGGVENIINDDAFLNKILWDFSRKDRDIQSQELANNILKQMGRIGKLHKKEPQKANFVVLKTPAIPSVLVETAFISNPYEERRLNNPKQQDKIADAIYRGVLNYFEFNK